MADSKQYLTEVGEKIQRVYSPKLIDLLICRFIKGMTQEQTAEQLDVSYRTEQRMEKHALQIFEEENMQNTQKNL